MSNGPRSPRIASELGSETAPESTMRPIALMLLFGAFACGYFLSTLLRAVTATLAPVFSAELGLGAGDLGLMAGAFFIGFAAMQLPLGHALDRLGPRRTLLALLCIAVFGCVGFASADGLTALIVSRAAIGMGVSACLMAALTSFRQRLPPGTQLRLNSWMLMTGALGMVATTLPVQWLLPSIGWRGIFWIMNALLVATIVMVAWRVPADARVFDRKAGMRESGFGVGYPAILRHPRFLGAVPAGFFIYGGLIAVQGLWAGPWLTRVTGLSPEQAAEGLFIVNTTMLFTFMAWGAVMPRLAHQGIEAERLMRWIIPLSLLWLSWLIVLGPKATAWHWAIWCMSCSVVTLIQPAVAAAFPTRLAGRALSAFNLPIFVGAFAIQWGIGLAIDALSARGWSDPDAFRAAFAGFGVLSLAAYLWFLRSLLPASEQQVA